MVQVSLAVSGSPAPLDRSFYSDPFVLNGSSESSVFNAPRVEKTLFKTQNNTTVAYTTLQHSCKKNEYDKIIQYNAIQLYICILLYG